MPSNRLTKTNIDSDIKAYVALLAAGRGISATQMLEAIIMYYIVNHDQTEQTTRPPTEPPGVLAP